MIHRHDRDEHTEPTRRQLHAHDRRQLHAHDQRQLHEKAREFFGFSSNNATRSGHPAVCKGQASKRKIADNPPNSTVIKHICAPLFQRSSCSTTAHITDRRTRAVARGESASVFRHRWALRTPAGSGRGRLRWLSVAMPLRRVGLRGLRGQSGHSILSTLSVQRGQVSPVFSSSPGGQRLPPCRGATPRALGLPIP